MPRLAGLDKHIKQVVQHEVARQVGQAFTALGASLRTIGVSLKRVHRQKIAAPGLPQRKSRRTLTVTSSQGGAVPVYRVDSKTGRSTSRAKKKKQPMSAEPQQAELVRD